MSELYKKVRAFVKDEEGLELSEYAVMAALVIIVAAGVIALVGGRINVIFQELLTALGG